MSSLTITNIGSSGLGHLLAGGNVLPAQYSGRRGNPKIPELHLVLMILQDAVDCFQKYLFASTAEKRREFDDAERWILSNDREWPFSFNNVCSLLDINQDYLREGLIKWKEAQVQTSTRWSTSSGREHTRARKVR